MRTARDLQKFNMMTAFATGALAIGILYMVLWKGKGQEGTKITLAIVMAIVLGVQSGLTLGAQSKYNDCQKTDVNFLLPDQTWALSVRVRSVGRRAPWRHRICHHERQRTR